MSRTSQRNIAVEWLYSRIQWYQAELAALQAGDTSKSGGMLSGAAHVRTRTKIVNGVGYVFAYNDTNAAQPATFTWHSTPAERDRIEDRPGVRREWRERFLRLDTTTGPKGMRTLTLTVIDRAARTATAALIPRAAVVFPRVTSADRPRTKMAARPP